MTQQKSNDRARIDAERDKLQSVVRIDEIVFDRAIYPRAERNEATVQRYAASMADGDEFPPVILETGTHRLLDGWHRVAAAKVVGRDAVAADHHSIPKDVEPKLYAASLSAKHGLPLLDADLRSLARELYQANASMKVAEVARMMARPRQTVQGWVQDLADEREEEREVARTARRLAARLLSELGQTQRTIAETLGVSLGTVSGMFKDAEFGTSEHELDERTLRMAVDLVPCDVRPDAEQIAEGWREARIFADWSEDERERVALLREGISIVVSYRDGIHENLIRWCEQAGLLVRVDRKSDWGNPFVLDEDGSRDEVIDAYRDHYLPHKPSLYRRMTELEGKALACWCAPDRCHADVLLDIVEGIE